MKERFQVTCKGETRLGDYVIPCYVAEGDMKVLSDIITQDTLETINEGKISSSELGEILSSQSSKPFLCKNKNENVDVKLT